MINEEIAALHFEVNNQLDVPIDGVISDGQQSKRTSSRIVALPGIAHGLCHFHYLRAAKVIYEADRHALKELKKYVRGIRKIENCVSDSDEPVAQVVRGYCLTVRGLTSDGRPPLDASGLKLHRTLKLD